LNLEFPQAAKVDRITLYYATGAAAFTTRRRVNSIDMSALGAGRYWLEFEMNGASFARNVVKH
jgi:hypothetical protein